MEILQSLGYLLLVTVLCCAEATDLLARLQGHRVKRHSRLDQSKLCKAFGCLNGHCKDSELLNFRVVCECYPGYQGRLCDRLMCPYDCGSHGTCAKKMRALYCKCDPGYSGPRCESKSVAVRHMHALMSPLQPLPGADGHDVISVNGDGTWFAHSLAPSDVKFSEFHSHALIDTSVKPDVCAPGFQCYHGVCDRQAMLYGRFQCLCKNDFTGLFCEKKCTLQCQNGGQCFVKPDGHQVCACPFDYQGYYCEKRIR